MSERFRGYLYCTMAMVSVGSTVVASKWIAAGLPPFTATLLRFAVALPIFLLLMRLARAPWPRLDRHDGVLLLIQAGAGSVGYTVLLLEGVSRTTAVDAGVIAGTLPVVAAVIAMVALGERPGRALVGAVLLATAGVLICTLLAKHAPASGAGGSIVGDLLVLGAVVCEGVFILLNKRMHARLSPLQQSTAMAFIGLLLAGVPALLESPWAQPIAGTAVLGVVYYALIPTIGGFLLWYAGSSRLSGTEAGLLTAVLPVSAMLLAALFLHEPIAPLQTIGVICVLLAMGLVVVGSGRRDAGVIGYRRAR